MVLTLQCKFQSVRVGATYAMIPPLMRHAYLHVSSAPTMLWAHAKRVALIMMAIGAPAVEALEAQPYTARLAAAGSRSTELALLLAGADADAPPDALRQLVLEQNIASKKSAAARTKVWGQLRQRYILDSTAPEYADFVASFRSTPRHAEQGLLCYLLFARTDRLFREVTLSAIAPYLARADRPIDSVEVQARLDALLAAQGLQWTEETRETVRQHLLSALKDFGVLRGGIKKRTTRLHIGPVVTWYAARLAQLEGRTARQGLDSVWFRLLGLDADGAIVALHEAAQTGILAFRLQAEVVELELRPLADWTTP